MVNDSFDRHDGSLEGYSLNTIASQLSSQKHYDLRSFYTAAEIIPWTMLQMELYNEGYFEEQTILALESGLSVSSNSENWVGHTAVGPDTNFNWHNTLRVSLTVGTPKTVTSTYNDDILTDFPEPYYIDILLQDFPAQGAAVKLDLNNSFVDFTSNDTFSPPNTDTFPFSASLNSLTGGGDVVFRIDRASITNADLENLKGIRFRLTPIGAGTMTFIAEAFRMFPQSGHTFREVVVDTKRRYLIREVGAGGTDSPGTTEVLYWNEAPLWDTSYYTRFNSGHNATSPANNAITLVFRYRDDDSDSTRVKLTANTVESRLQILFHDGASGTNIFQTSAATNILTQNTDYILKVDLKKDKINAGIYSTIGPFLGPLVYQTGEQTLLNDVRAGYVGHMLEANKYDFLIKHTGGGSNEFAHFESTTFNSFNFVIAANLVRHDSNDINVYGASTFVKAGDASTLTEDEAGVLTVTRHGNQWWGGITTAAPELLGDSRYVNISGEILPENIARGQYRIALKNELGAVVWMRSIDVVATNQWRAFNINVLKTILPDAYHLEIHQTGFYPDTFRIRNLKIENDAVAWWGSNDDGVTFYPFLNSLDDPYSALHFPSANTKLRVRGVVMDSNGWIQGYKLKPIYQYQGHLLDI